MNGAPVGKQLVGVRLYFCDADGNATDQWVDINLVSGLIWARGDVHSRPAHHGHGGAPIPAGKPPEPCIPGPRGVVTDPLCWWDGKAWVCD